MSNRLVPTDRYLLAKEGLSANARVALQYVEQGVADDPDHRFRRHERADEAVIDWSAEGLLVAYRRVGPDTVHLLDVIDIKGPPSWP